MGPRSRSGVVAAGVVLLLGGLVGCDDDPDGPPRDPGDLDPTGALAAFTLSPQAAAVFNGADAVGVLGVIRPDGSLDVVGTRPMDAGNVLWDERGLFAGDDTSDHVWSGGSWSRVESPKADFQNGLVRLHDSDEVLAVYNAGRAEDGRYLDDLVLTGPGGAIRADLNGDYRVVAGCGAQGVWGLGTNFGDDRAGWREGKVLVRRLDDGARDEGVWVDLGPEAVLTGEAAACRDGVLHALVARPSGETDYALALLTVDVASGEHQTVALTMSGAPVTSSGVSAAAAEGGAERLQLDTRSGGVGQLVRWWSDTGWVHTSDPATGSTQRLHDTGLEVRATDQVAVQFTEEEMAVLTLDSVRDTLVLRRFSRVDGTTLGTVEVEDVGKVWDSVGADPDALVLRGLAMSPGPGE